MRLRKALGTDVEGLVETQTDPRVRTYLGGPRPEDQVRAFIESLTDTALLTPAGCFVVADTESNEMLGTVQLDRRGRDLPGHLTDSGEELELTYVFRHRAWGRGYAQEAARSLLRAAAAELPDQPVLIVTQTANHPSLRLAARLGFTPVATFWQHDAEQTLATAPLAAFRSPQSAVNRY